MVEAWQRTDSVAMSVSTIGKRLRSRDGGP
jgi:hypothetical protein